jgi:ElaB/YqjD/DUF883 family membrane-anchored ribosome-binding protein
MGDYVSTDKLMKDMRTVVGDAEELLKATASQTGERVEKVRARAEQSLRAARDQLEDAGSAVNDQVHKHPWTTAGVAAGIGLLIGILIGRR